MSQTRWVALWSFYFFWRLDKGLHKMLMSTLAWIFHTKRWLTIVFTRLSERKPFKGLHWRRTLDQRCPDIIEFIYHSPTPAFVREYTHMDDHTRQITDTSAFTHLSPTTVFLIKITVRQTTDDTLFIHQNTTFTRQTTFSSQELLGFIHNDRYHVTKRNEGVWERE